ncbi:hypothetical protein [Brevundimonas sp.]|uniref:hypothetical protein n=1 Tax=Brevundimonas sp. TaxID=1871086 RepID=UPI002D771F34|nr:hypothetical protein [Brevundimonas sp.]
MQVLALLSVSCGWLRGGHPERFGALVLLVDYLATTLGAELNIRQLASVSVTQDVVVLLVFGWLALKADRWWPIAVTASLALCVLVRVLGLANPELSRYAILSALLGFWILLYVVVLGGAAERWLAGERAVSEDRIWRRRSPPRPSEGAATSRQV